MKYFAYILRNVSHTRRYKGHTKDLEVRIRQHHAGKTKSTKNDRWELEYFEEYDSRTEAIQREKYWKTAAGRRWINNHLGEL